jgi:delta14-sterol reductase
MLLWGDLVLVPFFYSIGGWTLLDQREPIGTPALLAIAALYGVSLWMFRSANAQKWRFKQDPETVIRQKAEVGGAADLGLVGIGWHLNHRRDRVHLALTLATGCDS